MLAGERPHALPRDSRERVRDQDPKVHGRGAQGGCIARANVRLSRPAIDRAAVLRNPADGDAERPQAPRVQATCPRRRTGSSAQNAAGWPQEFVVPQPAVTMTNTLGPWNVLAPALHRPFELQTWKIV